jgi:protein TonB
MKNILFLIFLNLPIILFAQDSQLKDLTEIEELPIFPGCEMLTNKFDKLNCTNSQFVQLIEKNINYPRIAREMDCQGLVKISFMIRTNGNMTDIQVYEDNTPGCGLKEEALRVIKAISDSGLRWIPAKLNGVETNVKMVAPIRFGEDFQFQKKSKK